MTFCLDSTIINPEKNKDIFNVVVLLHGYGGDGKDISILASNWKRYMPNTIFICPNGHESCVINPAGYQWFDLSKDDTNYVLDEVLKAEKKLNQFIDEIKKRYNLDNDQITISGFSQGCMMSINIGLTAEKPFRSIVGFSGKIINLNNLKIRKKNFTKTLLIHGDSDEIVPSTYLLEAEDFLIRNNIKIKTQLIKNCDHNIPIEASSTALNYILKKI